MSTFWREPERGEEWVLNRRRVSIEKFPEWAKKNIRAGDIVVLETTTNVWTIYDIVAPLASRVLVANAAEVGEIAGARVKTDKEDIKRLLKLLIGGSSRKSGSHRWKCGNCALSSPIGAGW